MIVTPTHRMIRLCHERLAAVDATGNKRVFFYHGLPSEGGSGVSHPVSVVVSVGIAILCFCVRYRAKA